MISRRGFVGAVGAGLLAQGGFAWPEGKKLAVSLSWDDARLSQIDTGMKVLEELGLPATFYVSVPAMKKRVDGWKEMVKRGYEIGNHSMSHACTGNYRFTRALEDFTLDEMAADIDAATAEIEGTLGVKPKSFAYPCGQKFIGRGRGAKSYVPLVAERFETGRGYYDEMPNHAPVCDLAALMGTHFDGIDFAAMREILEKAAKDGRWVVFAGHEIGKLAHQTTDVEALRRLAEYVREPKNGVWVETVGKVGRYVAGKRG